jgi:hypothetical protein
MIRQVVCRGDASHNTLGREKSNTLDASRFYSAVWGVTGSGVENSAKKDKSGQPDTYNSEGKKIQLYSFLEAETAAYVSSICFLKFPRSNRCRL